MAVRLVSANEPEERASDNGCLSQQGIASLLSPPLLPCNPHLIKRQSRATTTFRHTTLGLAPPAGRPCLNRHSLVLPILFSLPILVDKNQRISVQSLQMNINTLKRSLQLRAETLGSQKELADGIGISAQYLSDVLLGKRMPGKKILDWLGLQAEIVYRPRQRNGAAEPPKEAT